MGKCSKRRLRNEKKIFKKKVSLKEFTGGERALLQWRRQRKKFLMSSGRTDRREPTRSREGMAASSRAEATAYRCRSSAAG